MFYTFQWAVCQNHWTIKDMQWLNCRPTHNPIDSDINDESWCPAHGVPNPFNPNEIVTPVMPPSKFPQGQKTSLELDLIELTNLEGRRLSKFNDLRQQGISNAHPSCLPVGQASHSVAPSSDLGLKALKAICSICFVGCETGFHVFCRCVV